MEKFNLKGLDKKTRGVLESAIIVISNSAKNFFLGNFRKQGFDDKSVTSWTPRKKEDKRSGRGILIKSGDLMKSIISNPDTSRLMATISTNLDYAKVHNDGLKAGRGRGFKMPKRQFIGDSYNLNKTLKDILERKLDSIFK